MIKKMFFSGVSFVLLTSACQSTATKDAVKGQQLAQEAIAVHDEIMPQVSVFDRTTVKIDSILNNLSGVASARSDVDTSALKSELEILKNNLEDATDNMMTWMHGYVADSTDVAYQRAELEKIKVMKKQFEDVSKESSKKLSSF